MRVFVIFALALSFLMAARIQKGITSEQLAASLLLGVWFAIAGELLIRFIGWVS